MKTTALPCGCRHNDRWLVLCELHLLDWFDAHRIAAETSRPANDPRRGAREHMQ